MPRPRYFSPLLILIVAAAALAGTPATQPQLSNAAKNRAQNYFRNGWFLVDGNWARSQCKAETGELFSLTERDGQFNLQANPSDKFDPMLRNGRVSLIELAGSNYAWKLSAAGRMWNDTRSGGSQHLQLIAAMDDARADQQFRLTKIDINPDQQTIQAVVMENGQPISVILVLGRDFTECTAGLFKAAPGMLVRSTTARQLLLDRPTETRRYIVPLLKLVNNGQNPLAPAAGDVYRAFPDLPVDDNATTVIRALVPDLSSVDPAIRRRASAELQSLGHRGVQAAMKMNLSPLPFEAQDRITSFIQNNSRDTRTPEVLRKDSGFILDCLSDPDVNVRNAAGKLVGNSH